MAWLEKMLRLEDSLTPMNCHSHWFDTHPIYVHHWIEIGERGMTWNSVKIWRPLKVRMIWWPWVFTLMKWDLWNAIQLWLACIQVGPTSSRWQFGMWIVEPTCMRDCMPLMRGGVRGWKVLYHLGVCTKWGSYNLLKGPKVELFFCPLMKCLFSCYSHDQ